MPKAKTTTSETQEIDRSKYLQWVSVQDELPDEADTYDDYIVMIDSTPTNLCLAHLRSTTDAKHTVFEYWADPKTGKPVADWSDDQVVTHWLRIDPLAI